MFKQIRSEEDELFSNVTDDFVGSHFEDVETDSFGEGSAFSDDGNITDLDLKGR